MNMTDTQKPIPSASPEVVEPFAWNYCPVCGHPLERRSDGERRRPYCSPCVRFFYSNPVPAACCLVANGDALLLGRRAIEPQKGKWCFPGGFIELGESTRQAALRELYEETGLIGVDPELVGVSTHPSQLGGAVVVVGYLIRKWEGELAAGSDLLEPTFFRPHERPHLAFRAHRELLARCDAAHA